MKKAYLVHGWMGNPNNCWFPCLKEKLEELNFEVIIPQMPNPGEPKIETWVPHLQEIAKDADEESIFIGHSIGCQTILRFLEKINTINMYVVINLLKDQLPNSFKLYNQGTII